MSAPQFKIKNRVTLPVLQLKPGGGARYLRIMKPMKLGEKLDDQKAAAMLMEAVDLVTGEYGHVIPPTIMQNELNKHYPGESYVGKCFSVCLTRNAAKKYNHVSLAEVEDPGEGEGQGESQGEDQGESQGEGQGEPNAQEQEHRDASDDAAPEAEKPSRSRRR